MIIKRRVKIKNPQGLHARPASLFVKIANKYDAEVTVKKGGESVNGKSIMGLMTLAANLGSILEITTRGVDARQAIDALERFLLNDSENVKNKGTLS